MSLGSGFVPFALLPLGQVEWVGVRLVGVERTERLDVNSFCWVSGNWKDICQSI